MQYYFRLKMRSSNLFKFIVLLGLAIPFLVGCGGSCSTDQDYSLQFTITDQKSGGSFFKIDSRHPNIDSLRFFEESLTVPPFTIPHYISPKGEIYFDFINITNVANKTYYLQFNSADIDTLLINSQITPVKGPDQCQFYRHYTKIYFNNRLIKEALSDTTGFVSVELIK